MRALAFFLAAAWCSALAARADEPTSTIIQVQPAPPPPPTTPTSTTTPPSTPPPPKTITPSTTPPKTTTPPTTPPRTTTPPTVPTTPATTTPPSSSTISSPAPSSTSASPSSTISSPTSSSFSSPSSFSSSSSLSASASVSHRLVLTPSMTSQWHSGRVLYGIGSVTGLVGSALTLTGVIVTIATGYPCDPNDPIHMLTNQQCTNTTPPKPTDAAPLLNYLGSTTSALGFVFSATGLGLQHHVLEEVGMDPGRGVFSTGTAFGLLGFLSVGASYFFGLTDYLSPHDQGLAILTTTITGAGLCLLGGLLYTIDAAKLKRVWERVSTF